MISQINIKVDYSNIQLETADEIISKSPGKATVFLPWVKSVGSFHESFVGSPSLHEKSNIELDELGAEEDGEKEDMEDDKFSEGQQSETSDFFMEAMER